jgi:hypothetical protein
MRRNPVPRSGILHMCSRMPKRPTMPAEVTPDRHAEIAATRTAEAAERTEETATRTAAAAQRTIVAPSWPPTARCSPPSAPTPPGCAPG